jgi:hypothetical protein
MMIGLILSSLSAPQHSASWGPMQIGVASMAGVALLTLVVFLVRRLPFRGEDRDEEPD